MESRPDHADNRLADKAGFLVIALAGALLSVAITGFVYGTGNNIFHLPIVYGLPDLPQFAGDPFMQSLRYFSAGPFMLMRGIAAYVDPYWLFLVLHFASRLLAFVGFLACADLLGVRSRPHRALFAILLSLVLFMRNISLAGEGGLFFPPFGHSEIANGLTLILVYVLARGWLAVGLALNGLIFFTSAFFAVWNISLIAFMTAAALWRRTLAWRSFAVQAPIGLLIAAAFATPIVLNVLSNSDYRRPLEHSYIEFLEAYFDDHFLIWGNEPAEIVGLILMIALGSIAFAAIGRVARPFLLAGAAFVVVYAIGVVAPYLTESHTILNLHLLRVSSMLHMLTSLAVLALVVRWRHNGTPLQANILAPALAVVVTAGIPLFASYYTAVLIASIGIVAVSLIPLVERLAPVWLKDGRLRLHWLAVLGVAANAGFLLALNFENNREQRAQVQEWAEVANWARENTPSDTVFYISNSSDFSAAFETVAQRVSWIDWKRGAAAMWTPSYYHIWRLRMAEVTSMPSFRAWVAYAHRNGIDYSVDNCTVETRPFATYATENFCVFAVPR